MIRKKTFISALLFLLLIAGICSAFAAEKVYFYHTDPAGTPIAMSDSSGAIVWKATYKPFGEEYEVLEDVPNNREFVGKEKDEETGLYYFGARYMEDYRGEKAYKIWSIKWYPEED